MIHLSGFSVKDDKNSNVAFFSLEMSAEQLAQRILAEQSTIDSHKLRSGDIDDNEMITIVNKLQGRPLLHLHLLNVSSNDIGDVGLHYLIEHLITSSIDQQKKIEISELATNSIDTEGAAIGKVSQLWATINMRLKHHKPINLLYSLVRSILLDLFVSSSVRGDVH